MSTMTASSSLAADGAELPMQRSTAEHAAMTAKKESSVQPPRTRAFSRRGVTNCLAPLIVGLAMLTAGCGTTSKKTVINAALRTSDTQRQQLFEATARVLDEKPEYTEATCVAPSVPVMPERMPSKLNML